MPLYEYECRACGHCFEQIRKFSDLPLKKCPKCGKNTLQKLVSSPAIKFKGSGFYINDYAKKGTADTGKSATKDEKASPADSSKPAADSSKPASDSSKPAAASSSTAAAPASFSSKDS